MFVCLIIIIIITITIIIYQCNVDVDNAVVVAIEYVGCWCWQVKVWSVGYIIIIIVNCVIFVVNFREIFYDDSLSQVVHSITRSTQGLISVLLQKTLHTPSTFVRELIPCRPLIRRVWNPIKLAYKLAGWPAQLATSAFNQLSQYANSPEAELAWS